MSRQFWTEIRGERIVVAQCRLYTNKVSALEIFFRGIWICHKPNLESQKGKNKKRENKKRRKSLFCLTTFLTCCGVSTFLSSAYIKLGRCAAFALCRVTVNQRFMTSARNHRSLENFWATGNSVSTTRAIKHNSENNSFIAVRCSVANQVGVLLNFSTFRNKTLFVVGKPMLYRHAPSLSADINNAWFAVLVNVMLFSDNNEYWTANIIADINADRYRFWSLSECALFQWKKFIVSIKGINFYFYNSFRKEWCCLYSTRRATMFHLNVQLKYFTLIYDWIRTWNIPLF